MNVNTERRQFLMGIASAGASAIFAVTIPSGALAETPNEVIKVVASRFTYAPNRIMLKRGLPVVLAFSTLDMPMGFNAPDFGIRTDILPGKESRIRFTPDKVGEFIFHCDLFCGSGHEDMTGVLVVT
ncbi:cupredoxin domain-containing protein [Glaciimonas sp. CA11.2]|uniref:cupredoxin domain-containing protein n=1 Tax=unclassified Glaciimonas TaxID=2644401 RepID=UPI002AB59EF0|nr:MULTISPECIES: cupredoxin domain-containing protein [unclassified Glaciimonas]MDY7544808.1 cupredoxin domain-containing protein [Glaciimonas sp. CA11.2]MEB0011894.1 cupredoxin domain-containing protein [Glaciimonas sp. Cout2]MEB0082871.1 cupredoxin domain-containing protein [Glaciimonas sp. Gout2]MEB0164712.1 cupredoxin domain-containing protein [Glaciimonas sp. CA11.2]